MAFISCNNSSSKSVCFFPNGNTILVMACQDGEYWFSIGRCFKTIAGAKRAAVKALATLGYTFDESEMKSLKIS